MDEETQPNMPTEPAPPSDDLDTLPAARTRTAIALLRRVEAMTNNDAVDVRTLDALVNSYRNVVMMPCTESMSVADGANSTDRQQLEALSAFFEGARHLCGLPGTRVTEPYSTPERIKETLEALTMFWRNTPDANVIAEECKVLDAKCALLDANLTAARDENGKLAELLDDVDAKLAEAFYKATRQTSVSVLESDRDNAVKVCPASTGLLKAHAQRYAAIRELGGMALAERHLRNELQAANDDVAGLREQLAKAHAEINSIGAVLQDARKWTTYDFDVNSHGRRMDVLRSLAARAEALSGVQDALGKAEIDPSQHPANGVGILAEQRDGAQRKLSSTQAALQIANTQLQVANSNLMAALRLQQSDKPSDSFGVMPRLVALMNFWRKGGEPFRNAADGLEKTLRESLGDSSYDALVAELAKSRKVKTNEMGAILGVARHDAVKGDHVTLDVTGFVRAAGPFSASKGFDVSHGAVGIPPMAKLSAERRPNANMMPDVFTCGCSKWKVMAGHCDVYDEFGATRSGKPHTS